MPAEIDEPAVPVPAPAKISPVAFSSTLISIILFDSSLSIELNSTFLNIFFALIFWIDLLNNISL